MNRNNVIALRILSYLESLPDLSLQLESCDSTSESDTRAILTKISETLHRPLGGVMLMSAVFSDMQFDKHTQETYEQVFPAKIGSFEALRAAYPIEDLDFLISISSTSVLGNGGQTNYASANAVLDAMLAPYRNAFSIFAPAIIDTATIATKEDLGSDGRLVHFMSFAMTSRREYHLSPVPPKRYLTTLFTLQKSASVLGTVYASCVNKSSHSTFPTTTGLPFNATSVLHPSTTS